MLGPGVNDTAYVSFKKRISVPYKLFSSWYVSPIGFLLQTFWGFISLIQLPRVGMFDVGHKRFSPLGESPDLRYFPIVGHHAWGEVFGKTMFLPLLHVLMWSFYLLL